MMRGEDKARRFVLAAIKEAGLEKEVEIESIRSGNKHFIVGLISDRGKRGRMIVSHAVDMEVRTSFERKNNIANIRRMVR